MLSKNWDNVENKPRAGPSNHNYGQGANQLVGIILTFTERHSTIAVDMKLSSCLQKSVWISHDKSHDLDSRNCPLCDQ
jgi:hypothetical protein